MFTCFLPNHKTLFKNLFTAVANSISSKSVYLTEIRTFVCIHFLWIQSRYILFIGYHFHPFQQNRHVCSVELVLNKKYFAYWRKKIVRWIPYHFAVSKALYMKNSNSVLCFLSSYISLRISIIFLVMIYAPQNVHSFDVNQHFFYIEYGNISLITDIHK